jgi:hypothetical protein
MKPFALALRAVGSNLAMRLYIPVIIAGGLFVILILFGAIWLTTTGSWWWLFVIPLVMGTTVVIGIAAVIYMLIRYVRPEQTQEQKYAVSQFVDKIHKLADVAGTPKYILLFKITRSIAAPSKSSYLSELLKSRELAADFRNLQRLFTP